LFSFVHLFEFDILNNCWLNRSEIEISFLQNLQIGKIRIAAIDQNKIVKLNQYGEQQQKYTNKQNIYFFCSK
jgi:hypothetical protein